MFALRLATDQTYERGRKSVGSDPGLSQQAAALAGVRPCRAADRFWRCPVIGV